MSKNPKDKGYMSNTVFTGAYQKLKVLFPSTLHPSLYQATKQWLVRFKTFFFISPPSSWNNMQSTYCHPFSLPIFPLEKSFPVSFYICVVWGDRVDFAQTLTHLSPGAAVSLEIWEGWRLNLRANKCSVNWTLVGVDFLWLKWSGADLGWEFGERSGKALLTHLVVQGQPALLGKEFSMSSSLATCGLAQM